MVIIDFQLRGMDGLTVQTASQLVFVFETS